MGYFACTLTIIVSIFCGYKIFKPIADFDGSEFMDILGAEFGKLIESLIGVFSFALILGSMFPNYFLFCKYVAPLQPRSWQMNNCAFLGTVTNKHYLAQSKSSRGWSIDYKYDVDYSDIYGHSFKSEGTGSFDISPYLIDGVTIGDSVVVWESKNIWIQKKAYVADEEDKEMYRYPVITQNGEDIGNDTYHWAKKHPESALYHYGLNCAYRAVVTDYKAVSRELTFEAWNFYGDLVTKTIRSESAYNIGDTLIVSKNLNDTLLPGFIIYPESCKTPSNMDVLSGHGNGFIFHGEIIAKDLLFVELPLYEDYYYEHYKVNDL